MCIDSNQITTMINATNFDRDKFSQQQDKFLRMSEAVRNNWILSESSQPVFHYQLLQKRCARQIIIVPLLVYIVRIKNLKSTFGRSPPCHRSKDSRPIHCEHVTKFFPLLPQVMTVLHHLSRATEFFSNHWRWTYTWTTFLHSFFLSSNTYCQSVVDISSKSYCI